VDNKHKTCQFCGKELEQVHECLESTVTDLKMADSVFDTPRREGPEPAPAFLLDTNSNIKFPIGGPKCKIGRDPTNQVVIRDDPFSSRFHAWITCEEGHYFVEDLGSTNGTLLNGSPLTRRRPVVNGDRLRIGRSDFIFQTEALGVGVGSRISETLADD